MVLLFANIVMFVILAKVGKVSQGKLEMEGFSRGVGWMYCVDHSHKDGVHA